MALQRMNMRLAAITKVRFVVRLIALASLATSGLAVNLDNARAREIPATELARKDLQDRLERARTTIGISPQKSKHRNRLAQWFNWPNWNNWPNWGNWFNW